LKPGKPDTYHGNCLKIIDPLSFYDAHNACYSMGGHLARIDSYETNQLIGNQMDPLPYNPDVRQLLWIDYTDMYTEGVWLDSKNNTPGQGLKMAG